MAVCHENEVRRFEITRALRTRPPDSSCARWAQTDNPIGMSALIRSGVGTKGKLSGDESPAQSRFRLRWWVAHAAHVRLLDLFKRGGSAGIGIEAHRVSAGFGCGAQSEHSRAGAGAGTGDGRGLGVCLG